MNVLIVEPGYSPYEKEINGLHEMQAIVKGPIQAIYLFQEPVAVVCNEEGLNIGLPFNRSVPGGYGGIFGTFFVCGCGEEDFCSLTAEQIARYKQQFHQAEILIDARGNTPVILKMPPLPHKVSSSKKKRGERNERG